MARFARRTAVTAAALALVAPVAGQAKPAYPDALSLARLTAAKLGTTIVPDTGPISSDNVSLVTTVPGSFAGIRIVGKYAYATGWSGLTVFDISNPEMPTPVGALPLAHFENEDVDSDGKVVLISNDREKDEKGGLLYVVDVSDPANPALASALPLGSPLGAKQERGPGHIANCVKAGCQWVWLTGGTRIWVVDLRDPAHPLVVNGFTSPSAAPSKQFTTGATHDVERDAQGNLWVTGSGGVSVYSGKDVVHPKLLSTSGKQGVDPEINDFILHNSRHPEAAKYTPRTAKTAKQKAVRPGEVLLVTEEDYLDQTQTPPGGCRGQGKFGAWDIRDYTKGRPISLISQWHTEVEGTPQVSGNKAPVTVFCSSHWFTERKGLVADGWYEQGTRILDTRNPKAIRQIGYWMPPNAETWASYWVTDSIIYTADVLRGMDVIKISGPTVGAPTVTAPIRAGWLGAGTSVRWASPSSVFGAACLVPNRRPV